MKSAPFLRFALLALVSLVATAPRSRSAPDAPLATSKQLRFEENVGQSTDASARFIAKKHGASVAIHDDGTSLALRGPNGSADLTMKVVDGRSVTPVGGDRLGTHTNYFLGNDPSKWHRDVPTFGKVTYPNVKDGVDLVFHGEEGQVEYDFIVAPGADASSLALDITGADGLSLTPEGDLAVAVGKGRVIEERPRVYQRDTAGKEHEVRASYRLVGEHRIAFDLAAYDHGRPLVIDPVVTYGAFIGGMAGDDFVGAKRDSAGNFYVAGFVGPAGGFPVNKDDGTVSLNDYTAVPMKLDPTGAIVWATYLGGSDYEELDDVAIDSSGNSFFVGRTASFDFPRKPPQDSGPRAFDFVVAKLDSMGGLANDIFLGGSSWDEGFGITLDSSGNIFVGGATMSTDAYTSDDTPFHGQYGIADDNLTLTNSDVYVVKLDPSFTILKATILGGTGYENVNHLALDGGVLWLTGQTSSADFEGATGYSGLLDGIIIGLDPSTLAHQSFKYLGGTKLDQINALTPLGGGKLAIGGFTASDDFPLPHASAGSSDAFVATLNESTLTWSGGAFLAGSGDDEIWSVALGPTGDLYVAGATTSSDFPRSADSQALSGSSDAFAARFTSDYGTRVYSTLVGGTGAEYVRATFVDATNHQWIGGGTGSSTVPGIAGTAPGSGDLYLAQLANLTLTPETPQIVLVGSQVALSAAGDNAPFTWSIPTNGSTAHVSPTTGSNVTYTAGDNPGSDVVQVTNSVGDKTTVPITVLPALAITPATTSIITHGSVAFSVAGGSGAGYVWSLTAAPSGGSINPSTGAYTAGGTANATDQVKVTDGLGFTATASVTTTSLGISPTDVSVAPGGHVAFTAQGGSAVTFSVVGSGTITAQGQYTAGTSGNVTDTVKVSDSLGNSATASVHVGQSISVTATGNSVPPRGSLTIFPTGGSGSYTYDFLANASGGQVSGGLYVAGSRGNVTDVVRVTDSLGASTLVSINVRAGVSISPATTHVVPLGTAVFTAAGGSNAGYTYSLTANGSNGSISGNTYTAGSTGNSSDTVQVRDSLGNTATATVSIGGGLAVSSYSESTPPRGHLVLEALGGSGSYTWVLVSNNSGATVTSNGNYTAGAKGSVTDEVEVMDSVGAKAVVQVTVGPGLSIQPGKTTAKPGQSIAFTVTGGSGTGYAYAINPNNSGAHVDTAAGTYVAGSKGDVTDGITISDSLGNTASATVDVTAATNDANDGGAGTGAGVGSGPAVDGGNGFNLDINAGKTSGSGDDCSAAAGGTRSAPTAPFFALIVLGALYRLRGNGRTRRGDRGAPGAQRLPRPRR